MDEDAIWDMIFEGCAQNQIMCCSSPGHDIFSEKGGAKGAGIVGGHAYSLLDAKLVGPHKLVQIRNPWVQYPVTCDIMC